MAEKESKRTLRVELTAEQKEQIKNLTGREVANVKLELEELEERIAPTARAGGGGGTRPLHN